MFVQHFHPGLTEITFYRVVTRFLETIIMFVQHFHDCLLEISFYRAVNKISRNYNNDCATLPCLFSRNYILQGCEQDF